MATCRFHAHKGGKSYCPRCQLFLCENCGKPGTLCRLCNQSRLVDAAKAPADAGSVRTCTIHRTVTTGLKNCQGCEKPHCASCMRLGGLCVTCERQERDAREALPRPELPEEAPQRRRRKKTTRELSVEKKFQKGRKRSMIRGAIAGVVLLAVGSLVYFDYSGFKKIASMGAKRQQQMTAAIQGASNPQEDYDQLVGRLERDEATDKDVAETEALMAKIQSGQEVDRPDRELANRLAAVAQRHADQGQSAAESEKSRKMWAMLGEWSQEDDKPQAAAPAGAAPHPGHAPRFRPAAAPRPMTVGMTGLHAGQTVHGTAVVSAHLDGEGMLDHVELLVNGQWQGLSNQPPYRFEWDTAGNPNGPCTVQLMAYDTTGQKHPSHPVRVTIHN